MADLNDVVDIIPALGLIAYGLPDAFLNGGPANDQMIERWESFPELRYGQIYDGFSTLLAMQAVIRKLSLWKSDRLEIQNADKLAPRVRSTLRRLYYKHSRTPFDVLARLLEEDANSYPLSAAEDRRQWAGAIGELFRAARNGELVIYGRRGCYTDAIASGGHEKIPKEFLINNYRSVLRDLHGKAWITINYETAPASEQLLAKTEAEYSQPKVDGAGLRNLLSSQSHHASAALSIRSIQAQEHSFDANLQSSAASSSGREEIVRQGALITSNRRGPKPQKRDNAVRLMVEEFRGNVQLLASETLESLSSNSKISSDTATKARKLALIELQKNTKKTPNIKE